MAAIQNEYSLMCRHYDTDLAEVGYQEDVTLLAFSPLAAGFLTGWLHGKPLEVCAAWGARLGAEIVQVIGAELPEETWQRVLTDLK